MLHATKWYYFFNKKVLLRYEIKLIWFSDSIFLSATCLNKSVTASHAKTSEVFQIYLEIDAFDVELLKVDSSSTGSFTSCRIERWYSDPLARMVMKRRRPFESGFTSTIMPNSQLGLFKMMTSPIQRLGHKGFHFIRFWNCAKQLFDHKFQNDVTICFWNLNRSASVISFLWGSEFSSKSDLMRKCPGVITSIASQSIYFDVNTMILSSW